MPKINEIYKNIDKINFKKLMTTLQSTTYTYKAQQTIAYSISNRNNIGIIEEGEARVIRVDYNGEKMILDNLKEGDIFMPGFYSSLNSELMVSATKKSKVTFINYDELLKKSQTSNNALILLNNLFNIVNSKMSEKNERINLLTTKTIRNKLLSYFSMQVRNTYSKSFDMPMSYTSLADYLGVDRAALMRELKNMKDEGLIREINKKITILYEQSYKK